MYYTISPNYLIIYLTTYHRRSDSLTALHFILAIYVSIHLYLTSMGELFEMNKSVFDILGLDTLLSLDEDAYCITCEYQKSFSIYAFLDTISTLTDASTPFIKRPLYKLISLPHDPHNLPHLRFRHRIRRSKQHMITPHPIHSRHARINRNTQIKSFPLHSISKLHPRLKSRLCLSILHKLNPPE